MRGVLPWWSRWSRVHLQCGKPGFNPSIRKIPLERKWQPTAVFLPGESHGQRSLAGYSPWGHKEMGRTGQLSLPAPLTEVGNGSSGEHVIKLPEACKGHCREMMSQLKFLFILNLETQQEQSLVICLSYEENKNAKICYLLLSCLNKNSEICYCPVIDLKRINPESLSEE